MERHDEQIAIAEGMTVLGADGEKLGEIEQVNPDHVVVKKGFLFPSDYYIPASVITGVEENNVYLSVTKDEVMNQDPSWEQQPAGMAPTGGAAMQTGLQDDPEPFDHEQNPSRTHVNGDDELRVDVAEEELTATTRDVDRGDVRVKKDVVEEEQEIDVPVTEERVNVSRREVNREAAPGEEVFQEGTITVPVHGEEIDVQKRARVTGEVVIEKEVVQDTKRVNDTVRHEEVTVDGERVEDAQGDNSRSVRGDKQKRR